MITWLQIVAIYLFLGVLVGDIPFIYIYFLYLKHFCNEHVLSDYQKEK